MGLTDRSSIPKRGYDFVLETSGLAAKAPRHRSNGNRQIFPGVKVTARESDQSLPGTNFRNPWRLLQSPHCAYVRCHYLSIHESYVYWTVHHLDSWVKSDQLMPLALLFLYIMLNMFRMLINPSSGACDLCVELFRGLHWSVRNRGFCTTKHSVLNKRANAKTSIPYRSM